MKTRSEYFRTINEVIEDAAKDGDEFFSAIGDEVLHRRSAKLLENLTTNAERKFREHIEKGNIQK